MTKLTNIPSPEKIDAQIRVVILLLQIVLVAFFLISMSQKTEVGPTLDDSWIHFQFARNLVEHGEVSFNAGTWSTGTTSLLWDFILALGIFLGIPVVHFSIAVGILLYFILGQQIYTIFKSYLWERDWSPVLAILVVLFTGNVLWFALSGMETLLLLVLGLWWIFAFSREKYILAGLLAGALMLTRIEGMLFLLMGIYFVFRKWGLLKGMKNSIIQVLFSLPIFAPSIILNQMVYGRFYPATMAGRKWLYDLEPDFWNLSLSGITHYIVSWAGTFFTNDWWPEFMDQPFTIQYPISRFISGGSFEKTPPDFGLEPYPVWVQYLTVLIAIILFIILLRGMFRIIRPILMKIFSKVEFNLWEYLVAWFLGHNLIYLVLMPTRGHGGRYQAINFILAGMFLIAGTEVKFPRRKFGKIFRNYLLKPGILIIYIFSIYTWADIYAASVQHVNNIHRAAGEWLGEEIPPGTVIAAFDVGAVKYFSGLPVADIAGLTDSEALEYVLNGDILPYIKMKDARYLVMIEAPISKRQIASGKQRLFHSAFCEELGILDEIGKTVNLIPVKCFALPNEDWRCHWFVVRTHLPILVIYQIEWLNESTNGSEPKTEN